jgi:HlyD family secretion protein
MTDDERMRLTIEIMRAIGFERGTPASPEQIEKAKALAKEKGLDPDLVAARLAMPGGRRGKGGDGGGGASRRMAGSGSGGSGERGFNNTIVQRTLYKLIEEGPEKKAEPVVARLGVSDGFQTELLEGLNEGDTVVTGVTMPGAAAAMMQAPGGMSNPFQGGRSFGGPGGPGGSMRGR